MQVIRFYDDRAEHVEAPTMMAKRDGDTIILYGASWREPVCNIVLTLEEVALIMQAALPVEAATL